MGLQRNYIDSLLVTMKPTTTIGVPLLSVFRNESISSQSEGIVRLLAMYEFNRIARGSSKSTFGIRRRALFAKSAETWSVLAHAACGLVDAATIQV